MTGDGVYSGIFIAAAIDALLSGDYDRAIDEFAKVIAISSNDAEAHYYRWIAYEKKGDYELAIADYTKAIAINPDDAETYRNRGLAYGQIGRKTEANRDFEKYIELKRRGHCYRAGKGSDTPAESLAVIGNIAEGYLLASGNRDCTVRLWDPAADT